MERSHRRNASCHLLGYDRRRRRWFDELFEESVIRMAEHPVYRMAFAKVYPLLVQKAERKRRTKAEVDEVIFWLTGYDEAGLQSQLDKGVDMATFYAEAPLMNPHRDLIKGVVCGIRVETIEDPLMKSIRQLDKLVDELAKGKSMDKIIRKP